MSPLFGDLCESAVTSCDWDSETRIEEPLKFPALNAKLEVTSEGCFFFFPSFFDTTFSFVKSKNQD